MNEAETRIFADPKFQLLVRRRRRLAWWMTATLMLAYFGFCAVAVWTPTWLSIPLARGATLTLGVLIAYLIILAGILAAGYYVHRANTDLADLQQSLRREPE